MTNQTMNQTMNQTADPMDGALFDPSELDNVQELDSDDFGTLYSVSIGLDFAPIVAVYVTDDGDELFPADWQDVQPRGIDEMAGCDWVRGEDIAYAA